MLEDSGENLGLEDEPNQSCNELDLLGQLQNLKIDDGDSEETSQASNKILLKSNPVFNEEIPSTKVRSKLTSNIFQSFFNPLFYFRLNNYLRFWNRKSCHLKKKQ